MTNRERLIKLAASLPEEVAGEVLDFAEFLRARRGSDQPATDTELTAEDRTWLDADLSRLGEVEPYDWGPDGPPKGKPITWDDERQAFIIVGGRDEPT